MRLYIDEFIKLRGREDGYPLPLAFLAGRSCKAKEAANGEEAHLPTIGALTPRYKYY